MSPISFGIIGGGWRAEFYLRVAHSLPEQFTVAGVVVRRPEMREALGRRFGVPVFATLQELVAANRPQFVVTSVPRTANLDVVRQAAAAGLPVLSETPPAANLAEMIEMWQLAQTGARIQVAEQYLFQPHHAARLALLAEGRIGTPRYAQISVAHGYHALALVRSMLRVGFVCPTVAGRTFTSPVVKGASRSGPPTQETVGDATQALITFDFGDKLALYDFCGDQYFSSIWRQRLVVRGERGEVVDGRVTFLQDCATPVSLDMQRHTAGSEGNLEGHYLKGIQYGERWVYRNPLAPARLSDEEIAVGTCLLRMAAFVRTGAPCYSLADACQDAYLELLANEALKTGTPVRAQPQPWAAPAS